MSRAPVSPMSFAPLRMSVSMLQPHAEHWPEGRERVCSDEHPVEAEHPEIREYFEHHTHGSGECRGTTRHHHGGKVPEASANHILPIALFTCGFDGSQQIGRFSPEIDCV